MKNNYISYYELLTRIKERNIPPKIILHLVPNKSVEYISDYDYVNSEFIGYEILKDEEVDENYSYHLGDCFLENTMFDKVIEIIEEEKEIEKLKIEQDTPNSNYYIKNEYGTKCYLTKHSKMIAEKVNELIDEVKKLKEGK